MSNNQWVKIIAKLTLARSLLASAILDIDNAVCDIQRGDLSLSKESAKILETMIKDLLNTNEGIGDIAACIPDVFLELDQQFSQLNIQTNLLENSNQTVGESLINWNNFADAINSNDLYRKAS